MLLLKVEHKKWTKIWLDIIYGIFDRCISGIVEILFNKDQLKISLKYLSGPYYSF